MNLNDETQSLPFIKKLWLVIEKGELDFWEDRQNPPNLSVHEFIKILDRVDAIEKLSWVQRISKIGPYGKTGEDHCFKFECEIHFGGIFEIEARRYFIKGYFFEKKKLKGVCIQSFREV